MPTLTKRDYPKEHCLFFESALNAGFWRNSGCKSRGYHCAVGIYKIFRKGDIFVLFFFYCIRMNVKYQTYKMLKGILGE